MSFSLIILFLVSLTAIYECQPEMKHSFCPFSDPDCEPSMFGSNVSLTFGTYKDSDTLFYDTSQDIPPLSVSCTAAEPLRWILTAYTDVLVYTWNSRTVGEGENLRYYYRILFSEARPGIIRCESYENSSRAAEIYVAVRKPQPLYYHTDKSFQSYFPRPRDGAELVIPCLMDQFDTSYDFSTFRLIKLKLSKVIPSPVSLSDDCLKCFCKYSNCLTTPKRCAAGEKCGPLQISNDSWIAAGKLAPDGGWNSTALDEWSSCSSNFKCASQVVRKLTDDTGTCNGDVRITCSDYFTTFMSYPNSCKDNGDAGENFKRVEGCLSKVLGEELSQDVADYDPRIGFRVRTPPSYPVIFQCPPTERKSAIYLIPIDPGAIVRSTLQFKGSNEVPPGISCSVPQKWMEDTNLDMIRCTSLFHCDLTVQKLTNQLYLRDVPDKRSGVAISENYPSARIFGLAISEVYSHGIVICDAAYLRSYIKSVDYFFTGLDSKSYFITDAFPASAVIRVTNESELALNELVRFQCTISTFLLFPTFKFMLKFSNGSEFHVESPHNLPVEFQFSSESKSEFEAYRILTFVLTNDLTEVSCTSPWMNSTKWARETLQIQIDVTVKTFTEESVASNLSLILAFVFLAIFLASLVASFVAFRMFRQAKKLRDLTLEEVNEFLNGNVDIAANCARDATVNVDGLSFPLNFQIQPTDINIDMQSVLGEGQFGRCVSGKYQNQQVAVKMTKTAMDVDSFKDFLREVKIMAFIGHHKNIIHFVGAVVDKVRERICIAVVELSPFGDLLSYLRYNDSETDTYVNIQPPKGAVSWICPSKRAKLTVAHLCYFCEQIASGMDFVASKKVIHGDLAARNVLVFPNYVVKITDFGLSRKLYNNTNYTKKTQTPLPWRWMALESLKYLEFTSMSDAWAFGVTAWEIFSMGQVPFAGLTYSVEFMHQLEDGLRLSRTAHATDKVFQFIHQFWNRIPSARPTFSRAAKFFETTKEEISLMSLE